MKWCTTGGPVLHLGRCCGTPLKLGGNLLEEVEDAGMRRLLLLLLTRHRVTQGRIPSCHGAKKKEKENRRLCCNMTSTLRSVGLPVH